MPNGKLEGYWFINTREERSGRIGERVDGCAYVLIIEERIGMQVVGEHELRKERFLIFDQRDDMLAERARWERLWSDHKALENGGSD